MADDFGATIGMEEGNESYNKIMQGHHRNREEEMKKHKKSESREKVKKNLFIWCFRNLATRTKIIQERAKKALQFIDN